MPGDAVCIQPELSHHLHRNRKSLQCLLLVSGTLTRPYHPVKEFGTGFCCPYILDPFHLQAGPSNQDKYAVSCQRLELKML
jgi:hypothetical protein